MPLRRKPGEPWTQEVLKRYVRVENECWLWLGTRTRRGYGQVTIAHKSVGAHRLAYELYVGPIPDGLHIDHLCCTPRCVNPAHLEPVSQAENNRRRGERQTHCLHGHEYTPENTYSNGPNWRRCKRCLLLSQKARRSNREPLPFFAQMKAGR